MQEGKLESSNLKYLRAFYVLGVLCTLFLPQSCKIDIALNIIADEESEVQSLVIF